MIESTVSMRCNICCHRCSYCVVIVAECLLMNVWSVQKKLYVFASCVCRNRALKMKIYYLRGDIHFNFHYLQTVTIIIKFCASNEKKRKISCFLVYIVLFLVVSSWEQTMQHSSSIFNAFSNDLKRLNFWINGKNSENSYLLGNFCIWDLRSLCLLSMLCFPLFLIFILQYSNHVNVEAGAPCSSSNSLK